MRSNAVRACWKASTLVEVRRTAELAWVMTKRQVIADQQWRTVKEEDEQNKQLLGLSQQILGLTKEIRGFAGLVQQGHEQNEQLLDLSRRTLALTEQVHDAAEAGGPGSHDSSGPPTTHRKATHDAFRGHGGPSRLGYVPRAKRSRTRGLLHVP